MARIDDPLLVRRFERLRNLRRDRQRINNWNRAVRDAIGQRRPFDQLHHQRDGPARLLQAVDVRDVRVVQRRENFGFALKAGEPVGVRRDRRRQDFDRDLALQVGIGGAVHLTHAAHAEQGDDVIRTESRAGC